MKNILIQINKASELGNTTYLSFLKSTNSHLFKESIKSAIVLASYNGHINVLNWFKNNFPEENLYTCSAIEMASCGGQINVLHWFKTRYDIKITNISYSAILACSMGHLKVLTWLHSNMTKIFQETVNISCMISHASYGGHNEILDWIYENITQNFMCLYDDMDIALENKKKNTLYWFKNKFPLEHDQWKLQLQE